MGATAPCARRTRPTKANQSHDLTVVDSYIHGTYENAIDFVAVQRATIERNILAEADDWCAYVKGGSTQITVRGNEIRDCGTGASPPVRGLGWSTWCRPT